jgi:hypothetical protein
MKFKRNENLCASQRKVLIKGLTKVAELYFSAQHQPYGADPKKVNIGCGICKALHDLKIKNAYDAMSRLMQETNDYGYGQYVTKPEEWEPRANMCLFLVEYLKDTIKKEKV